MLRLDNRGGKGLRTSFTARIFGQDMPTELDLRGYQCPLPVLKTRNAMRKLQPGEQILVLTDDPLAGIDIPAFCNETGQKLIEQASNGDSGDRFLLERQEGKL